MKVCVEGASGTDFLGMLFGFTSIPSFPKDVEELYEKSGINEIIYTNELIRLRSGITAYGRRIGDTVKILRGIEPKYFLYAAVHEAFEGNGHDNAHR